MYEQISGATDNAYAKVVIQDIINEENTHAGQFLELLMKLQPDEEAIYAEGAKKNQGKIMAKDSKHKWQKQQMGAQKSDK
jgi:rubrerythrin